MRLITLKVGYGANCYIVSDDITNDAVVIDPGAQGKRISKVLNENGLIIKAVFLTHGHFDHVSGLKEMLACREESPDIWVSEEETKIETFPYKSDCLKGIALKYWNAEDVIRVGSMSFSIICTPGHSPGSVCILIEDWMFSGDTLFKNAIGRTGFVGSDRRAMVDSLCRIASLKRNYRIFPGHEDPTTLFDEIETNPYLRTQR